MKRYLLGAVMLVSATTYAGEFEKMSTAQRCEWHTKHALYGATQQLRGASRDVQFISREMVAALVEHQLGSEKLYIMNDDDTPEDLEIIRASVIEGYDSMRAWRAGHKDELPDHDAWQMVFRKQCMSRTGA